MWSVKDLRLDLDSYRGRYTLFSVLVGMALVTFAYLGWNLVNSTSQKQIDNITARTVAAGVLVDAQMQLNRLENGLHRILNEPLKINLSQTEKSLHNLDQVLLDLVDSLQVLPSDEGALAEGLLEENLVLEREVQNLIDVRRDVESWFPAMNLMLEEMYPHNKGILSELQLLRQEVDLGFPLDQQVDAINEIATLQRLWMGITGELRLMVANQFGLFASNQDIEPQGRNDTINDFGEQFIVHVENLESYFDRNEQGFILYQSLLDIKSHYKSWMMNYQQVLQFMDKPTWRMDLHIVRETITPLLDRIRQRFSHIDLTLDTQSADGITQLTTTAKQLSLSILGMAMLGLLMLFLAFQFIKRNLLLPIGQTVAALKQEASGGLESNVPPNSGLREIQDLVDAFSDMRNQVHNRQRHLDHVAHHDALTQLPNRVLFHDRLEHALAIALRGDGLIGLMFLDLDRFKQVNDSLGHLAGDELLKQIAERLISLVRSSDTVARLSGDEFAILIEGISSREDMVPLAEKILHAVEQPVVVAGQELRISTSIGIAMAPFDDVSADYLIRDADTAMYEAKRHGRAAYRFFNDEMTQRATKGLKQEHKVRQAVEAGQFRYHFQPILESVSGRLLCYEALLRWHHPQRGILTPEHFLSVLDDTGLITTLFEPLLEEAILFQAEQDEVGDKVTISINLSARLLNDPVFCRNLLENLVAGKIAPRSLILEITEDTLTQELAEADQFLQQAKLLGVRIALDDFGTGQASLSHLRQFPFDLLKIDREFIHGVVADSNDASLVRAMIQLAHAFNIAVIAEGVENESQLSFLQQQDCDYIQGYLLGTPRHRLQPPESLQAALLFET
ncbi:EAL domain-containing protein [Candidatus Thiodiazotropha sp. CDECU1]|uniref:EAL domain-containing protein n=1 Tax=Candidatus Thiodiazotropha sp. CDECU1 TaxID=3065865 RepID=UPI00292D488E|nr:EAL domain-containing protein [Candidatus Thiodiazotropha sp. CDECU1]